MKRKWPFVLLFLIIVGLISYLAIDKYLKKINSIEYKLNKIGYNETQITNLKKKLNKKQLDNILTRKYNKRIPVIINEKYFIFDKLDEYLNYEKELEEEKNYSEIIAIINTHNNKEYYKDTFDTDISFDDAMLVNKFYHLNKDYQPNDLIDISNKYSYGSDQKLRKKAYDAFLKMWEGAKKDNITLIINSSYRDYESQESIYNEYTNKYGEEDADKIAAKPGHSEHQTGYAIDIQSYKTNRNNFDQSEAFNWLINNAYKYGFILRYPKDKEYLTGYDYESWHFRYVGKKIAKYIQDNNITFDEYYSFYLEKK